MRAYRGCCTLGRTIATIYAHQMNLGSVFRHAVSLRAWTSIGFLLIGGWTTLWQLNLDVYDPDFVLLSGGLSVLAVGSWIALVRDSVQTERDASALSVQNALLHAKADSILAQVMSASPVFTNSSTKAALAENTNDQLRRLVYELTRSIREFGIGVREDRWTIDRNPSSRDELDAFAENLISETRRFQDDFNSRLRPEALALRAELERRLGPALDRSILPQAIALDHGVLAGAQPAEDAAAQLEIMAAQLPS